MLRNPEPEAILLPSMHDRALQRIEPVAVREHLAPPVLNSWVSWRHTHPEGEARAARLASLEAAALLRHGADLLMGPVPSEEGVQLCGGRHLGHVHVRVPGVRRLVRAGVA